MVAILIACFGAYLFVSSAKQKDMEYTEEELVNVYLRPFAMVFIICSLSFLAFTYWFYKKTVLELLNNYQIMKELF